jgi:protein-S-isoprenylcysteine O-methyltransferase Ste14
MYLFLIPLLAGFAFNLASAFTAAFCRRWGERRGRTATFVLRNILGIPLWAVGICFAVRLPAPPLFAATSTSAILAWLLLGAGAIVIIAALFALRMRAALPSTRDTLAEHGVYARVRHPIYAGMVLEFGGIVLAKPTLPVAVACALGLVWLSFQARFEEADLLERVPGYRAYMGRVPRFLPRIRPRGPL